MTYTYCLDAYASLLWNYEDKRIEKYYVAWRKEMRKVWKLPNLIHFNLLPVITNCLPIKYNIREYTSIMYLEYY